MGGGAVRRLVVRGLGAALAVLVGAGAGVSVVAASPWGAPSAGASVKSPDVQAENAVQGHSYSLVTNHGGLMGFGGAVSSSGQAHPPSTYVGAAATENGEGAWVASANGSVETLGDASAHGSMAGHPLYRPVVGIAATPTSGGYWLVASDGGIFTFGNAVYHGSMGGHHLAAPIVGIAATPTGGGYWEVASDGGIFTFGNASYYGSEGGRRLAAPIVGMAATPTGHGYWLVASDGGIFTFGNAAFYGSEAGARVKPSVVGMAATPTGRGYWLTASNGSVFSFGDAPFFGSAAPFGRTVVGMAVELGGYMNPLRGITGLTPERVDQGVDFAGRGPIYAIGNGVVLNTKNAGWPGGAFITYQLTDGPAAGDIVYVAENVVPRVRVGQLVDWNTVLGTLVDAYPNLETGWADPPGTEESLARAMGEWSTKADDDSLPTAYGENFNQLLTMLGERTGVLHGAVQGAIAPGWPTWLPNSLPNT